MPEPGTHNVFKVVIDGVELPQQIVVRINRALQQVILSEIASAEFGNKEVVVNPIMKEMLSADIKRVFGESDGGTTGGIWVRANVGHQS